MSTISIVPDGRLYTIRTFWDKSYITLGYISYQPGPECWLVCDRDLNVITRHASMRDARAHAKEWFGDRDRRRAIVVGVPS